jgi:putative transposase
MIDKNHQELSIRRQSQLLLLNRSSLYVKHKSRADELELCNMIAEIYSSYPIYGYRRITAILNRQGVFINHKRVLRLMQAMNLRAIYPGPNTSKKAIGARVYPYLLSNLTIDKPGKVWQVDITYLRTNNGFMYLTAFIDVYSRMVVGWRLSNDLQVESCLLAFEDAIAKYGRAEIVNSDQGSQFTSDEWIKRLKNNNIQISMTGKGRCNDNANIERLWRSFKYEGSYLYKWNSVFELKQNIPKWLYWYNKQRPHQALSYKTPQEKYYEFMDKSKDLPTISQYQLHHHDLNFVVV